MNSLLRIVRNFLSMRITVMALVFLCAISQVWWKSVIVNSFYLIAIIGVFSTFFHRNSFKVFKNPIVVISATLFFVSLASWHFSPMEGVHYKYIKSYIPFLFLGFVVVALVNSRLKYNDIIFMVALAGISFGVSAIYAKYTGVAGRLGGIENAVNFGNSAILIFVAGLGLLLIAHNLWLKTLLFSASLLSLYAAVESGTRGSFIAVPVLVLIGIIYICKTYSDKKIYIYLLLFLLVVASAFLVNQNRIHTTYKNINKYVEGKSIGSSEGQRFELWKFSVCIASEYPLLGVGTGGLVAAQKSDKFEKCGFKAKNRARFYYQAHSVYFHSLATMGYVGLVLILALFLSILVFAIKSPSRLSMPLLLCTLTFIGYGATVDLFFYSSLTVRHLLLISIFVALIMNERQSDALDINLHSRN